MTNLFETSNQEERPSNEDWSYKTVNDLTGGLNVINRANLLKDGEVIKADNVRFDKDAVIVDSGYTKFGQVIRGKPRITFQFFLKTGSSHLILITNATFYVWNSVTLKWHYVHDETSTTLTVASPAADLTLDVASITGFSNGDFIGVDLDSGQQHQTTINGAPAAGVITMTDAIPAGENAAIGKTVSKAVDLTGSDDISISIATWAAFDKMYFANGVDAPKEFDGLKVVNISNLPTATFSCRLIAVFENHLVMMHTQENGTAFPQRVRWGEPGLDNSFNASINFLDLYDSEDWIVATAALGNVQVIYKERSIYRQEFIGLSDQTFQFTRTIDAEGALNQDAVINLGDEHFFMGNSNIYSYDGSFAIQPVGDNIFDKVFAQDGELNASFSQRSFGIYIEELDEAWWFYPSGSDQFPQNVIRLRISTNSWSVRNFNIQVVGFGFFQSQSDATWATLTGTWAANIQSWISKKTKASAPTLHICAGDTLQVHEYDYITATDDGTAISYELITKDYDVQNRQLRFDRYDFVSRGSAILIEVSYDAGISWETLGTISPGVNFIETRLFKQSIGRSVRFRFTGSSQFALQSLGFTFKRESIFNV